MEAAMMEDGPRNPEYNGEPDYREPLSAKMRGLVAFKLRETAQYLSENGWVKGQWYTDDGRMCALSALRRTCGVLKKTQIVAPEGEREAWMIDEAAFGREAGDLYTAARRELEVCIGARAKTTDGAFEYKHGSIPDWNDADDRTEAEVGDTLRNCADRVESGQGSTEEAGS